MKKHNLDPAYGEGPAKCGLVLALVDPVTRELIPWPVFPPLTADEIEMHGWPVDEHGRGLTILEKEQQGLRSTYDLPNEAAA